jgi:hypothetical protein
MGMFGRLFEQIAFGTEAGIQRHDHGFADRIDRRVGDLGELLTQVVEWRRTFCDNTAIGVSSPIEPMAS